jgi:3-oxoacyl-[acyl-carrier protein] reductase
MKIDLKDRVALVTGGARDIGRAAVLGLADAGAAVVVNYFGSGDKAQAVVEEVRARRGTAVAVRADVTRPEEVARLVTEARRVLGERIHILVNNAGGLIARKRLDEMDSEFWDAVLTLNLKSVFLVTRAVLPFMPQGGAIVNLASLAARDGGGPGALAYATAKGGVLTLTRGLSKELAARKIRVNCVSPGLINTTFHDTFTKPEVRQAVAARTSVGREGEAVDVANAITFLASEASSYINGESIEINGGLNFV